MKNKFTLRRQLVDCLTKSQLDMLYGEYSLQRAKPYYTNADKIRAIVVSAWNDNVPGIGMRVISMLRDTSD